MPRKKIIPRKKTRSASEKPPESVPHAERATVGEYARWIYTDRGDSEEELVAFLTRTAGLQKEIRLAWSGKSELTAEVEGFLLAVDSGEYPLPSSYRGYVASEEEVDGTKPLPPLAPSLVATLFTAICEGDAATIRLVAAAVDRVHKRIDPEATKRTGSLVFTPTNKESVARLDYVDGIKNLPTSAEEIARNTGCSIGRAHQTLRNMGAKRMKRGPKPVLPEVAPLGTNRTKRDALTLAEVKRAVGKTHARMVAEGRIVRKRSKQS